MRPPVPGPKNSRAGTALYFNRHDGEAATCDDFVAALEDASGVDLTPFKIWYSQAGTPRVSARLEHDPATKTAALHLEQRLDPPPGQPGKQPMPLPLHPPFPPPPTRHPTSAPPPIAPSHPHTAAP